MPDIFRDLPGFDDWRADFTSHLERRERGPDEDEGDDFDHDCDTETEDE